MKVAPNSVTKYDRNDEELLLFWLFCLFVRGKNADTQATKLSQFWVSLGGYEELIWGSEYRIDSELRAVKAGQYESLTKAILHTGAKIRKNTNFLRDSTVEQLEAIPGVGPKTARFFVMNTRPDQQYAALDTHILRYLNAREDIDVPRSTPTGDRYRELEERFLLLADFEGVKPVDMDLAIWQASRDGDPLNWRQYYVESA